MKNITRLAAFALLAALAGALPRSAGAVIIRPNAASSPAGTVPNNVNYQGRLVDNGFPVTGFKNVTFKIYDDLANGTMLQAIGPQLVSVNQGLFSTTIAISTQALAGPLQKYLEVTVGTQKLSPREPLNSVPYALVAKSLEENLAISTVSVGTQLISSGTLSVASIQALNNSTFFTILSNAHMSSSTLTLDGNAATSLTTVGNVGIGTANPGSKLNVSSGTVIVDGNAATSLVLDNSAGLPVLRFREIGTDKGTVKSVSGDIIIDGDTAGSRNILMNTNSAGSVGVGATVPGAKLDVDGTARFGNPASKSAFSAAGALTMANSASLTMSNAPITLSGSNGYITSLSSINASAFFGDATGLTNVVRRSGDSMTGSLTMLSPSTITVGGTAFSVANTVFSVGGGRVGVGAVSPATKLHMSSGTFTIDGNVSPSIVTTGNVGIGTSNPASKLHLSSGTLTIDGNTATSIQTTGAVGIAGGPGIYALQVTGNANVTGTLSATGFSGPITGTASSANNLTGGSAGVIPFQSGAGATSFTSAGTSGQVLTSNGAVAGGPGWTTATNANTFGAIVQRDGSGNFSAGTITATTFSGALSGNATTASALASAPTTCTLPNVALGVGANGNASCSTPTNVTGNAATATTATTATTANALANTDATGQSAIAAINSATAGTINAARLNASGLFLSSQNKAALSIITPSLGQVYYCNNCTPPKIVVATGTAAGNFADALGGTFQ